MPCVYTDIYSGTTAQSCACRRSLQAHRPCISCPVRGSRACMRAQKGAQYENSRGEGSTKKKHLDRLYTGEPNHQSQSYLAAKGKKKKKRSAWSSDLQLADWTPVRAMVPFARLPTTDGCFVRPKMLTSVGGLAAFASSSQRRRSKRALSLQDGSSSSKWLCSKPIWGGVKHRHRRQQCFACALTRAGCSSPHN